MEKQRRQNKTKSKQEKRMTDGQKKRQLDGKRSYKSLLVPNVRTANEPSKNVARTITVVVATTNNNTEL